MIENEKVKKILYGGDYNPEQWPEDTWEEDMRLLKLAHIDVVTLNVFSWASLQPDENTYCFEKLDKIMELVRKHGLKVCLATSTGAHPAWMARKYPDILRTEFNGMRRKFGGRHNSCPNSPTYRKYSVRLAARLAERYKGYENIVAWHISNEYGGECYCENCERAFRVWLKDRYKTIDEWNRAWNNSFWGHTMYDWEDAVLPNMLSEHFASDRTMFQGISLDYRRFNSDSILECCKLEYDALKAVTPDIPVTTNMMGAYKALDYQKWAKELDFVSWDNYPSNEDSAASIAFRHDLMRGVKQGKPFALMEQTPSVTNWLPYNALKRPGVMRLWSYQAVAHGADTVMFFQMKRSIGACEKYHGAVIDHVGNENTRVFREVAALGAELEVLEDRILGARTPAKAAIYFDWENWWAVEDAAGPRLDLDYKKTFLQHYRAFWEAGLDVDIISMERELEGYRMVVAPLNYLYRKGYAERVERYVKEGGIYITTYWSGIVDDNDLCFTGEHPLEKVLGICQEEIDAPGEGFVNSITFLEKLYHTGDLCEIIHCKGARTVSVYMKEFYAGAPAVTENRYGDGRAYYLAAEFEQDFLNDFYREMTQEARIENPLGAKLPYGVTTALRKGEEDLIFVQNFNDCKVMVKTPGRFEEADSKIILDGEVWLEPFECKILTEI